MCGGVRDDSVGVRGCQGDILSVLLGRLSVEGPSEGVTMCVREEGPGCSYTSVGV